jgi:hypothetical protein
LDPEYIFLSCCSTFWFRQFQQSNIVSSFFLFSNPTALRSYITIITNARVEYFNNTSIHTVPTCLGNMRYTAITLVAIAATSTSAFSLWPRQNTKCPAVWTDVAAELQEDFAGCGANAHQALRAPFHDCINNGCDGSLVLTNECERSENAGLSAICTKLKNWSDKYNVSVADMIQFAGAQAIAACPLGPKIQALVGRKDSSTAAPVGSVPSSRGTLDSILAAFSAKGFSSKDVVALMGAHSVALQFHDDPAQAGKALDSTPSECDNRFYKETKDRTAPYSLQSDLLMSNSSKVCLHPLDTGS